MRKQPAALVFSLPSRVIRRKTSAAFSGCGSRSGGPQAASLPRGLIMAFRARTDRRAVPSRLLSGERRCQTESAPLKRATPPVPGKPAALGFPNADRARRTPAEPFHAAMARDSPSTYPSVRW